MWDFEIGRALAIMARTWPFVAMRLVVYFGITLAYVVATGTGAGVGYGVGNIFADPGAEVGTAFWGGAVGFVVVSVVLYWIREYILYTVKAGHIAVMVHLIEGREVPNGQSQIAYAREVVTARFAEANVLFALDQLIKGVIGAITGLIGGVAAILPIPGLDGLVRLAKRSSGSHSPMSTRSSSATTSAVRAPRPSRPAARASCSMRRTPRPC